MSSQFTEESFGACVGESLAAAAEEPWIKQCSSKYSEEDLARIQELGMTVATIKCFLDIFTNACEQYVKTAIMDYGEAMAAAASG